MKFKIIADSSCDLGKKYLENTGIDFGIAPLTINVKDKEFIDNSDLNIKEMLGAVMDYKEKSTSACPSPACFLDELSGADKYFIVTISSKLSGSFNSANVAKGMFAKPENVFVIDSLSVSGTMILIIDKLVSLIKKELSFDKICTEIEKYAKTRTDLLFVLDKFDNLVKNGRVSSSQALIASVLSIKSICASCEGEIKFVKKAFGTKLALKTLVKEIATKTKTKSPKNCIISHCFNPDIAETLKKEISENYDFKNIRVIPTKGLCSFYALEKGIIVSFEN